MTHVASDKRVNLARRIAVARETGNELARAIESPTANHRNGRGGMHVYLREEQLCAAAIALRCMANDLEDYLRRGP